MNLTAIEKRQGVSKNEIDVAFDVAIGEILPRGPARTLFGIAGFAVGVDRVLVAEETDMSETVIDRSR